MKALLGIALSLALTQGQPSQSARASVEGQIVRSAGGQPLADVTVELIPAARNPGGTTPGLPPELALAVGQVGAQRPAATPRLSAVTATDGKFVISDVPAGDYRLYATHPNGYV